MENQENDTEMNEEIVEKEDLQQYVDTMSYSTGEALKVLQKDPDITITKDSLRYYTDLFEDYMEQDKVQHGQYMHRKYSGNDIETIRTIFKLKKDHTNEEIKAILDNPSKGIMAKYSGNEMLRLLVANNEKAIKQVNNRLEEIMAANQRTAFEIVEQIVKAATALQSSMDETKKQNELLKEQNEELKHLITEMKEAAEKPEKKRKHFWSRKE